MALGVSRGWPLGALKNCAAGFLASGSRRQEVLDQAQLDAALQRRPRDRGLAPLPRFRYKNGFWAHEIGAYLPGCEREVWIPFLSGYGGITMLLLPNGAAYYDFSDDGSPLWLDAALQAHRIGSLCK